jgi:predicted MFS family arabinose efflux permease
MIAIWGVGPVFAVNAASFAVAIASIAMVSVAPLSLRGSQRATFRDGLSYLRSRPDLVVVIVAVGIAATFAFNYALFTVLMAREEFAVGAHQFGIASSVLAVGAIVGSLVAARMRPADLRRVFLAGVAFGLATAAAGLLPTYATFLVFLPVAGLAALTFSVAAQSYLQLHSAMSHRGRVMGMYTLVFFGGNPIGAPILGWVSDVWGPRWTMIGGGTIAAVALAAVALAGRRWLAHKPTVALADSSDRSEAVYVPNR